MRLSVRPIAVALLAATALTPAVAAEADVKAGDLVIGHPWMRATPKGAAVAGGYLTISNHGAAADTLTGGSTEVGSTFELHDMTTENGVMRMRPTGPLAIPAGGSVALEPSGRHIMVGGLKHALRMGDVVAGTLQFAHAGTVPVRFTVEGIGARAPLPGMKMD